MMLALSIKLAKALSLMPDLELFSLYGGAEKLLRASPKLALALLSIRSLKDIRLAGIRVAGSEALGQAIVAIPEALPHLQGLHLAGSTLEEEHQASAPLFIPRAIPAMTLVLNQGIGLVLDRLKHQLSSVYLERLDLGHFLRSSHRGFGSIQQLSLSNCPISSIDDLATTFSGLRALTMRVGDDASTIPGFEFDFDFDFDESSLIPFPSYNQPLFRQLEMLEADYQTAFNLLRCGAIDRKTLAYLGLDGQLCQTHLKRDSCTGAGSDCPPFSVLRGMTGLEGLSLPVVPFGVPEWWDHFGKAGLGELKYLYLSFGIAHGVSRDELEILCNHIPNGLSPIPLRFVTLTMLVGSDEPSAQVAHTVARAWAQRIPTLKYLELQQRPSSVSTGVKHPVDQRWIKIQHPGVRDGGTVVDVVEVSAEEGLEKGKLYRGASSSISLVNPLY